MTLKIREYSLDFSKPDRLEDFDGYTPFPVDDGMTGICDLCEKEGPHKTVMEYPNGTGRMVILCHRCYAKWYQRNLPGMVAKELMGDEEAE